MLRRINTPIQMSILQPKPNQQWKSVPLHNRTLMHIFLCLTFSMTRATSPLLTPPRYHPKTVVCKITLNILHNLCIIFTWTNKIFNDKRCKHGWLLRNGSMMSLPIFILRSQIYKVPLCRDSECPNPINAQAAERP
jgi:hypothetical protein